MTKRKKIILLCSAIFFLAGIGATIPLLVDGDNSSQSSTADTSSTEVSVSMSSSFVESIESTSTDSSADESTQTTSSEFSSDSSEASDSSDSANSGDSTASSEESSQLDGTMSAFSDFSSLDTSSVKELVLGENTLSLIDEQAAFFTPSTDGSYLFTASAGVRIVYFSTVTLRYEEVTGALPLTAGTDLRLILYAEGEQTVTIHIEKQ